MKNYLIVVDMQNDFIDGSLGTKEAEAIVDKVAEKIRGFYGEVIFTRDTHAPEYLGYEKISLRLPTNETMWEAMINEMSVVCANYKANFDYWYNVVYGPVSEN